MEESSKDTTLKVGYIAQRMPSKGDESRILIALNALAVRAVAGRKHLVFHHCDLNNSQWAHKTMNSIRNCLPLFYRDLIAICLHATREVLPLNSLAFFENDWRTHQKFYKDCKDDILAVCGLIVDEHGNVKPN